MRNAGLSTLMRFAEHDRGRDSLSSDQATWRCPPRPAHRSCSERGRAARRAVLASRAGACRRSMLRRKRSRPLSNLPSRHCQPAILRERTRAASMSAMRSLADPLHVRERRGRGVEIAQRAVQICELTQQCVLAGVIQPGVSPQVRPLARCQRLLRAGSRKLLCDRHAGGSAGHGRFADHTRIKPARRSLQQREVDKKARSANKRKAPTTGARADPRILPNFSGGSAMWIRKIERDLKKGVDSPLPTQVVSNEEFMPRPQTERQKQVEAPDRRDGRSARQEARHGPPRLHGAPPWASPPASSPPTRSTARLLGRRRGRDLRAGRDRREVVRRANTSSSTCRRTSPTASRSTSATCEFVKNMGFNLKNDAEAYSFKNFVKEMFFDCETSMVVISGVPGREIQRDGRRQSARRRERARRCGASCRAG